LGSQGEHVIVVEADDGLSFGLLVEQVLGVEQVDPALVGPPPPGQDRAVVAGVVRTDGELVMMLDLVELRGRLVG
jgi:chemotaxis signal transduction protein